VTDKEKTSTLERLERTKKTLRKSEQTAAGYILRFPDRVALLPLRKLAQECGVSEATILRLCRALGFNGYQDFKISLIPQLLSRGGSLRPEVASVDGTGMWRDTLFGSLSRSIESTLRNCDMRHIKAAARLIQSASRITVAGLGGSAGVAYILADSLTGLGHLSVCSQDPSYLQVLPGALAKGDLVIGISHSGETPDIALLLKRSSEAGASTIALTNYERSPVSLAAGLTLFTSASENLMGSYSCEPRIVELAVIEALVTILGSGHRRPRAVPHGSALGPAHGSSRRGP
jgi:RpiR family transcriptional regulator, carbohydrate utilization regulator